ncbi:SDR family NAD(P)-dependent oxidoreductase [Thalassobaculum sp.]|jgi:NAD(P)-dependent dehydrogenase (short-subunit alcohol dehydrogenase family)|uniref:SDR family NAD(P)-dependent oxidoreductase n=1 Tax=Thalassobaculum sp. TaxID=2022740 RepID=UPI003B5C05B1
MRETQYPDLAGRTVFVTGGASGIGSAIVTRFCAQGANVGFIDIAEREARGLIETVRAQGHTPPVFVEGDVRNLDDLRKAISAIRRKFGMISVLVNNAAKDDRHTLEHVTEEYWDDRFSLLVRPMFFAAQAVNADMRSRAGGSIINLGAADRPLHSSRSAYDAAKGAVHGLTRSLAYELGRDAIRVNTVSPGWVLTDRQRELWLTENAAEELKTRQSMRREITPQDVANVVVFLASLESEMITGQEIVVDGGYR